MNNALLLTHYQPSQDNAFLRQINEVEGLDARCTFRDVSLPSMVLRRLALHVAPQRLGYWFDSWKEEINRYDTVIYIASEYSPAILTWVHAHNDHAKLINYYWDKISISQYPILSESFVESWSFDASDCETYGLRYNPQFFCPGIDLENAEPTLDTVCICADRKGAWKHRVQMVRDCYRLCERYDIHAFFHFYTNNKDAKGEPFSRDYLLPASEYYGYVRESKSIIEIVEPGQEWVTLRTFEALANHKKLITNNASIRNEAFYSKDNIFILGEDDEERLKPFLASPFDMSKDQEVAYHSVDRWTERFMS